MRVVGVVIFLACMLDVCDGGRSCLSCSGVEGSVECSHITTCGNDEVCYLHRYTTESGKEYYDSGCSVKQSCPSSVDVLVGKRAEGRLSLCYECCNNTDLCNQNIQCNSATTTPGAGGTNVYDLMSEQDCRAHDGTAGNLPRECSDINPNITASGVYTIYPFGVQERPVRVFCEFDTSSRVWTVIQQRANGSVNFYKDWESYKQGFGSPYGAYWLGNDIIHVLTSGANHELMINMSDFDGVEKFAAYSTFHIGDEANGYVLFVRGYTGTAGDALDYSSGSKFSTYDKDNDGATSDCAVRYKGAWWFNACMYCDLNGEYLNGDHPHNNIYRGVFWLPFKGAHYSLKSSLMMIRKNT